MPNFTKSPEHRVGPPRYPHYSAEQQRLNTFAKWPKDNPVKPETLTKAGFFYVGKRDRVRCFQCGCEWRNWEAGDSPLAEHKRCYPQCAYFFHTNSSKRAQKLYIKQETVTHDQEGRDSTPKWPYYALEQHRTQTFTKWPKDSPVKPEKLIEAGFFYVGDADRVKCFFCDGGLRLWEADDEPLEVHRQWYPKCPYILWKVDKDKISRYFSRDISRQRTRPANMVLPRNISTSSHGAVNETKAKSERVDELDAQNKKIRENLLCKLCHKSERNVIFLPCGHLCLCQTCAQGKDICIICQNIVSKVVIPQK